MLKSGRVIVGIPCDVKHIAGLPFHAVGEKYIDAVRDVADAFPILLPVTKEPLASSEILDLVDGLFFTGSLSNVSPELYGGAPPRDGKRLDTQRDATSLPLLTTALDAGMPVFAVCRGMQELNVALGGTLDQHVEELPGRMDHRDDDNAPVEERYGPAHEVAVAAGGLVEQVTGLHKFEVNSLHSQAIARLAPSLKVEATAPDGTIEAVSRPGSRGFVLAVQWHPEWRAQLNPVSVKLLQAFGKALREKR